MKTLEELALGDPVIRWVGGRDGVPMRLTVSRITDERIVCGPWEFDRASGAEIDEFLGWGPPPLLTGSFIEPSEDRSRTLSS